MMSGRLKPVLTVGVPLLLFVAVLVFGMVQSGDGRGRPGVNDTLGEVAVTADPFGDFTVTTLYGESLKLSELRGSIVMIDFWSSWCPPCRAEAPVLAEAYEHWAELGVEFVGIAIWDEADDVQSFVELHGIDYPNAIDDRGEIAVDFGVKGIPEKFFVNRKGEIVRKINGPNTAQSLDEVLTQMSDADLGIDGN